MNARQAVEQNELTINELLASSKEMAVRHNITVKEAIDKKIAAYIKYAKTDNERVAWEIRGEAANKKLKEEGFNKFTASGEKVTLTGKSRDLGHGKQLEVIYSDDSQGWEHESDLLD